MSRPTVTKSADGKSIVVTFWFDFSLSDTIPIDFSGDPQLSQIELRAFMVDLGKTSSVFGIVSQVSQNPLIQCDGRTCGYYPCFFDAPAKFQVTFNGAADINPLPVQFFSKVINGPVWPTRT